MAYMRSWVIFLARDMDTEPPVEHSFGFREVCSDDALRGNFGGEDGAESEGRRRR